MQTSRCKRRRRVTWALCLLTLGCPRPEAEVPDQGSPAVDASLGPPDGGPPDAAAPDAGGDPPDGGVNPGGGLCTPTGFCFEYPEQFGITLHDVWAASKVDAWAVGFRGAILHFDGSRWSIVASPTRHTLYGISGRSPSDILAVGQGGTVLRYDGARWSVVDVGTRADLYDVAMPGVGESWIAGEKVLLRHTGATWQAITAAYEPTTRSYLHAVDGAHLWLFHAGIAQFWDGSRFVPVSLDTGSGSHAVTSVSGKQIDAVYACVERENFPLRKWNGSEFALVRTPTAVGDLVLNRCAVESVAENDVWLFGDGGIGHFDGTSWSVVDTGRDRAVLAAWSSGREGIAVGWNGRVLVRSGGGWAVQNRGAGLDYTFAMGLGAKAGVEWTATGGALLQHARRGAWTRLPHDKLEITSVLPVSATQAWATTTHSGADAVLFWDGTRFESRATAVASYWMNASWQSPDTGELIFVGQSGITGYSGGAFTRLTSVGIGAGLNDVDGAPGSDTWVVGDRGGVWRRRMPAGFVAMTPGTSADLAAVRVVSNGEVYLGGTQSVLLRYDGSTFKPLTLPTLHPGSRNFQMVVDIDGELSTARGLWVLVSGGEVIELHEGKAPVIHSLFFDGNQLKFTAPNELVVIGSGNNIVRKIL